MENLNNGGKLFYFHNAFFEIWKYDDLKKKRNNTILRNIFIKK